MSCSNDALKNPSVTQSQCVLLYIMYRAAAQYSHTLPPYITDQLHCRHQTAKGECRPFIWPVLLTADSNQQLSDEDKCSIFPDLSLIV